MKLTAIAKERLHIAAIATILLLAFSLAGTMDYHYLEEKQNAHRTN